MQRAHHLARRFVALVRHLVHRLGDDTLECCRDRRRDGAQRPRLRRQDLIQHAVHRLSLEGPLVGEQLVQHAADGEDVRRGGDRAIGNLLGRHVGRCANDRAGAGGVALLQACDAEVHDFHAAVGHDADVRRFDVAMNHAPLVREMETGEHFDRDVQLPLERERIPQRDHVGEIASLDELHRDEQLAFGLAEIVDRDDVGVLNRAGRARFAEKTLLHVARLAEARAQQLQRDVAPQHRVVGFPHDAHRPFAEQLVQLVFAEPAIALLRFAHRVSHSYARFK